MALALRPSALIVLGFSRCRPFVVVAAAVDYY
jgi:hypothetical protein